MYKSPERQMNRFFFSISNNIITYLILILKFEN